MTTGQRSMLWQRLDVPGHDACRLLRVADGWMLNGAAVFRHEGQQPAALAYAVTCDPEWRTQAGSVTGWIGEQEVSCVIQRSSTGTWTLNDDVVPGLDGCVDLDFGFTPATNLLQLRRIALAPGQGADVPVAWLDADARSLERLHQRYERRTESSYWYDAPRFGYSAMLEIDAVGFAREYPKLWAAQPTGRRD